MHVCMFIFAYMYFGVCGHVCIFGLVSLFNSISTFEGNLKLKPLFWKTSDNI